MQHCHSGHDIFEMYHRNGFRCDCGNGKFSMGCSLNNEKDYFNELNRYNKNFFDRYCYCGRAAPDEVAGSMV